MMRKSVPAITICLLSAMFLLSCAASADVNPVDRLEAVKEGTLEDGKVAGTVKAKNDRAEDTDQNAEYGEAEVDIAEDIAQDTEPEENAYDGGPDWVSLADEFIMPTNRMCIEDAVTKYSITLFRWRKIP